MLLERGDVIPNQDDPEDGYSVVDKMLSARQDIRTTTPDNCNQTPPPLALNKRHHDALSILQDNANSHTTNRGGPEPLAPSAGHGEECAMDVRSRSHDPNTNTAVLSMLPAPPPVHPDEREKVLDLQGPVSERANTELLIKPSVLPQPPSILPLQPLCPPTKTNTHPKGTRSSPSFTLNRYFLIASFICLLAFLVYSAPLFLPRILSPRT